MSRSHGAPTMRDVALEVGVSKQTVSAVINGAPGITEETRRRVLAAIEMLVYRPHSVARSLATGRTHTIALLVSDLSTPFMGRLTVAAEDCARSAGYRLVLYDTHEDPEREATYFAAAIERGVDGVLFVSATDNNPGLDILRTAGIPTVAIDRIPEPYTGPAVILDNVKAGCLAGGHLLSLGHQRFAHISGPESVLMVRERAHGLRQALAAQGIADLTVEVATGWDYEAGYDAMRRLLARPSLPTALFASGDALAIGALCATHEAGLAVPGDISIMGVDDVDISRFSYPPLTTIRQSITGLATLGLELLLGMLNGKEPEPPRIVMEPALVVRKSTASPRS